MSTDANILVLGGGAPALVARHHGNDRLIALYGIESPGLKASLAIGRYVRDLLDGAK